MKLEPEVERSITRHRRRAKVHKLIVLMPLVILLLFVLLVVTTGVSYVHEPEFEKKRNVIQENIPKTHPQLYIALTSILLFSPLLLVGAAYYQIIFPRAKQFKTLTKEAKDFDKGALYKFRNALEAVSIGAGILSPDITVIDIPGVNAISFKKGKNPSVGITKESLNGGIAYGEIEAVMAHEVSHIILGDELKQLNPFRGVSGILLAILILFPIASYLLIIHSVGPWNAFVITAITVPFLFFIGVPLSFYLMTRPYSISKVNPTLFHKDILADSLAAKLTNNPEALQSAIEKFEDLMEKGDRIPEETIGFTQLFVGPLREWPIEPWKHVRGLLTPKSQEYFETIQAGLEKQAIGYVKWQQKLIKERLANLQRIEKKEWSAFKGKAS